MKKVFFIAALAVFGFSNMNAQDASFGVKGGVNFANIAGDDTNDAKGKTSFHVGAVAEFPLSVDFSIQPEVIYSSQGYKFKDAGTVAGVDYSYENKTQLDYINVPIMGKYYLAEGFSLEFGPQVGFLISAKNKSEGTISGLGTNESEETDIKDSLKSVDYGLNIGVGYKLDSGLNFGARYNLGLSDINDVQGYDGKNQNRVIQLSIGYMF